ncbi:hypothetical protein ABC347_09805 [Sphingomonas sp. 1P06PA]|uniref:hypothetical protein n=1 Tax=Sphingomonas sp. 1P06PA TaxID=554121 RepID=UPI0039A6C9C2
MQRVRIGLTGLAIVFLLTLLAAALFGLTRDSEEARLEQRAAAIEESINGSDPAEPLAELGVTPGGTPETTETMANGQATADLPPAPAAPR